MKLFKFKIGLKMKISKSINGILLVVGLLVSSAAFAGDHVIKVGVLHSLSGTMAISETTLKDTMLMLIDEQIHIFNGNRVFN